MAQCSISKTAHATYAQFLQFSLVYAAGNGILCALFDAAAVIRRQLSTILLETCAPCNSSSPLFNPLPFSLSYLRLLEAIGQNGQRAPFRVAFKVLFHFIAISIFNWFCFISHLCAFCVFLFCAHTHAHEHTHTHAMRKRNLLCIFLVFRLLIANCLVSLTLVGFVRFGQPGSTGQHSRHSLRPHLLHAFLLHSPGLAWSGLAWPGLIEPTKQSIVAYRKPWTHFTV